MDMQLEIEERQSAFQSRILSFAIVNIEHLDISLYLNDAYTYFFEKICGVLQIHPIIKVQVCLKAEFEKYDMRNDTTLYQHFYFATKSKLFDIDTATRSWYEENIKNEILKRIENFEIEGSGWKLSATKELLVICYQYKGLRGASYIDLPSKIKAKRAVVNVQNYDHKCFKWAILSKFRNDAGHSNNLHRVLSYADTSFLNGYTIDFTRCVFPMDVSMIQRFEQRNLDISINVYTLQNGVNDSDKKNDVIPLRITKSVKSNHINMLLLQNGNNTHYCWIKNFSALVSSQLSSNTRKKYICDRCQHYFISETKLNEHFENCITQNKCPIILPIEGDNFIRFKHFKNQLRAPFCIYADIESILEPIAESNSTSSTNTQSYQRHIPYSIGYYLKSDVDAIKSTYKAFRGPNCIKFFMEDLHKIYKIVEDVLETQKEMKLTGLEELNFINSTICHICSAPFNGLDIKVRDHCHLTGKYRGSAHQKCNLSYQHTRTIPVIFHNLSGYDSHFLIQDLMTTFKGDISLIPLNYQNYISFTKTVHESSWKYHNNNSTSNKTRNTIKFKFLDSFRFMSSSLDELAKNLLSEDKKILHTQWAKRSVEDIKLLERKGVFPYDYVDSWKKLKETSLPSLSNFYSKLYERHISQAEFDHAQLVWTRFGIKTLGQYSDLYLQTDVLLLADVFEKFRESCMKIYTLDPAHYYTTPGFSWDAMLKYTKVEIELFTDIDMVLFIERGIRGGVSQCSTRYAASNNKYMRNYDDNKLISYLLYLDVNNLYGYAMTKKLPLRNFHWDDCRDIDEILKMSSESIYGFILEVDLEYPRELHYLHKDYPMCPERMCPQNGKHKKLLLTLYNKKNYVIHYEMLKFVLSHGLKLTAIHRILKFEESEWLKPYIELNTEHRTKATNSFEKNLYKLMSNAVYGKTMENVRNRVDIKLKSEWDGRFGAGNLIAKPNFKKCTIFNENLIAIEMEPTEIKMFKPIVIGMSILDLSKIYMCDFHYNHMRPKYADRCVVLYTDTDSFIYKINAKNISDKEFDIYEDMKMSIDLYDTSDYPSNNPMKMPRKNKKKPGLMKDECCGKIMTEFAGVRSKAYSFKMDDSNSVQKAKGITYNAIKLKLQFHHYVQCVKDAVIVEGSQNIIQSKLHKLYTVKQKKIFLSPFDDKRQILSNNIDTLPWGYNP